MALEPPVVVEPLYACAQAVGVAGAAPGAQLAMMVDGESAGSGRASAAGAATIELDEALAEGATVTVAQVTDSEDSGPSSGVVVRPAPRPRAPRVLRPVVYGVSELAVSGVTPGSHVTVHSADRVAGEAYATEPLLRVPVRTIQAPVRVTAELCGETADSGTVEALPNPSHNGDYGVHEETVDFGAFTPPALDEFDLPTSHPNYGDADLRETPLRGRLFRPLPRRGRDLGPIRDRPLVVVAHGYMPHDWEWWDEGEPEPSLEGYAWLGRHLAGWGMFVCSIDLSLVNLVGTAVTGTERQQDHWVGLQYVRGEVVLEMLDRLLADLESQRVVSRDRLGLVGHSVGGEAVVIARALERERRVGRLVEPYDIRGVVGLAPHSHTDHAPVHTSYLQLHSPADYVMGHAAKSLYDPAWRPRTHAWIDGAGHYGWNSVWREVRGNDGEIDVDQQEQIGRRLITAFFLDALLDQSVYRRLLTGQVPPPRHPEVDVRFQHGAAAVVVDDFGDGSHQLGLPASEPAVGDDNRLGGSTGASGFDHATVVDLAELAFSDQRVRGLDLAWSGRGAVYEAGLNGLAVDPRGALSLRLAQHYAEADDEPDETWNPRGADLDLFVELSDGSTAATVRLGAAEVIGYPFEGVARSALLRTIRLPVDTFLAVEPDLDLGALDRVRVRADASPTGRLLCGGIEVDTPLVTGPSTVRMLRVHQLGGGYGPSEDHLDTEAVVALDDYPDEVFGLMLRRGPGLAASQAALATLRSAITTDTPVRISYTPTGPGTRRIVRVAGHEANA